MTCLQGDGNNSGEGKLIKKKSDCHNSLPVRREKMESKGREWSWNQYQEGGKHLYLSTDAGRGYGTNIVVGA